MTRMIRTMMLAMTTLAAALCVTPVAQAELLTAATGSSWHSNNAACFRRDYGRVSKDNNSGSCYGVKLWTVGARNITGNRTFKATGCAANGTGCAAIVTNQSGWLVRWTGQRVLTAPVNLACSPTPITLGTLSVAATEGVVFECNIATTGSNAGGPDWVGSLEY